MNEVEAKLKQAFDAWKTFEKACEVLMSAIISKEKGDEKVPQQKEKLGEKDWIWKKLVVFWRFISEDQLKETAEKVKTLKA